MIKRVKDIVANLLISVILNEGKKKPKGFPVCIYHDKCLDGLASAKIVNDHFNGFVEFIPGDYDQGIKSEDNPNGLDPNLFKDRDVYIVDFSFKRDDMLLILSLAANLTVLDHHASAKRDIGDVFNIDTSKCGALLTWKHFNPNTPPPYKLLLIDDRDRWQWMYLETGSFTAFAFSRELTIEWLDELLDEIPLKEACEKGRVLNDKKKHEVNKLAKNVRRMTILGHDVPVVNSVYEYASELGNKLAKGESFAVIYEDIPVGRKFSLRSDKDGVDVSKIAVMLNGGGHQHASGFTIRYEDPRFPMSHVSLEFDQRNQTRQ